MIFRTLLLVLVALLSSCRQAGEPPLPPASDHEEVAITEADIDMPANYSDALTRIASYRDTIRNSVEAGAASAAHRPLDELDIVLDKLPWIAKASGIPKEHWETVNLTGQELRGLFNQIHSAIDGKREPDYKAVAEPIEQAITKLKQVAP